ncbi:ATP-binding protein [Nereida sp. MMG025]|uniref:sensor histidine kinase NtrY-like n=1 Tax=Nereida sp. MMG025 TaxID=2909981 RepID=UPI00351D7399
MSIRAERQFWERFSRFRRRKQVRSSATIGLVVLGPVLALATFLVLGPFETRADGPALRLILLADLVYILVVAALVMQRVAQMVAARRAKSAGSRLHLRLTGVFALVALIPTVLVAIFAGITVNVGLEGWFSDRVKQVVGASLTAAEAYESEHRNNLARDAIILSGYFNIARDGSIYAADNELRTILEQVQPNIQTPLKEAYIIDGAGDIRARGERSYLFDYEQPTAAQIAQARDQRLLIIEDWDNSEFRALVPLEAYVDRLLYISRSVDGQILNLLDETQETAQFYQQLERDRGRLLFDFGLLYLGFAVMLILASIWLGLWFAERLSRPVGRLAGAARRVGMGDLDVRVPEESGDDEIAMLGRYFNQMTKQLKGQRNTLLDNTRQIERRRRLFDSVLTSVTSGVVGLDAEGRVSFVNKSAERLLDIDPDLEARPIGLAVPEFGDLFGQLKDSKSNALQGEVKVTRNGKTENLLVRMAPRLGDTGPEGYVVAFDDVTDLVSAQRMAAWGDVARRIAHEIKNPLTPIQLSAERIKRKFGKEVAHPDDLKQMTDVIVRQTNDLRRIVDEFSKFARMPEPERRSQNLTELVSDAVVLQDTGSATLKSDLPDMALIADLDATMISQALNNLIKNAGEAIESRAETQADGAHAPEIRVRLLQEGDWGIVEIEDNGIGLPADRAKLFEPYVTTREKGTGLGLPIVKKIIEEHGGTLELTDASIFEGNDHAGAKAVIRLPLTTAKLETTNPKKVAI